MQDKQILDSISFKGLENKYVIVQNGYFKDRLFCVRDLISVFDPSYDVTNDLKPVTINYGFRSRMENLPFENGHLVYGHIQKVDHRTIEERGEILHLSELINNNGELVVATQTDIEARRNKLKYNPKLLNENYTDDFRTRITDYVKNGFATDKDELLIEPKPKNIKDRIRIFLSNLLK